jgi:hypothetical protein
MKLSHLFVSFIISISALSCQTIKDWTGQTPAKTETAQKPSQAPQGIFIFDEDAFKTVLESGPDSPLKNLPPDVLNKALSSMKSFQIEVKGSEAIALFGKHTITSSLEYVATEGVSQKWLMTPTSPDEAKDTVHLIFSEESLVLDPGKSPQDRLYFKKKS